MLNFDFLEKGVGLVSPPHFLYEFSRKMFLMLYLIACTSGDIGQHVDLFPCLGCHKF